MLGGALRAVLRTPALGRCAAWRPCGRVAGGRAARRGGDAIEDCLRLELQHVIDLMASLLFVAGVLGCSVTQGDGAGR